MKFHRPADQRGTSRHGTRTRLCTFSSGDYHDSDWMGFGALRQLNEELLPAGTTVPAQRVANMELLTLVIDGTLVRDGVALDAGTLAWTGAGHASETPVERTGDGDARVLRIALQPDRVNLPPAEGVHRLASGSQGCWTLRASPDGEAGALPVRQRVRLRQARLAPGAELGLALDGAHRHWLQVLQGQITIDAQVLTAGDALGWQDAAVDTTLVAGAHGAALLLFTLPG